MTKRTSARRDKRRKNRARKRLAWVWPTAVVAGVVGIIALVVVLAAVGGGQSQFAVTPVSESNGGSHAAVSRTGGPAIHFPTTSVDFGPVPLDTNASYAFEFTNMGDDTLRIEGVDVKMLEGC